MITQDYSIIDAIYPVGSIYMNVNEVNPSTLFPDTTWVQLKGKFLLGSDADNPVGTTGGAKTAALSSAQLPAHTHDPSSHGENWVPNVDYQRTQVATGSSGRYALTTGAQNDYSWGSSGSSGSGAAHNNMPPYLAVNIWKRTA